MLSLAGWMKPVNIDMSDLVALRRKMHQRLRERELEEQKKSAEMTNFLGKLCRIAFVLFAIGLFTEWLFDGLMPHLLLLHG